MSNNWYAQKAKELGLDIFENKMKFALSGIHEDVINKHLQESKKVLECGDDENCSCGCKAKDKDEADKMLSKALFREESEQFIDEGALIGIMAPDYLKKIINKVYDESMTEDGIDIQQVIDKLSNYKEFQEWFANEVIPLFKKDDETEEEME